MTSLAKIAANRANAVMSTGPRTLSGKAVASQNGRTHGLLSGRLLLPDENKERLASLRRSLHAQLQPVDDLETLLVDRMVACAWRLRRLHGVEVGIFESQRQALRDDGDADSLGAAFARACRVDTFSKLTRYETSLERAFYRALHELQRVQAVRSGQLLPPPLALDVDVTLASLRNEVR